MDGYIGCKSAYPKKKLPRCFRLFILPPSFVVWRTRLHHASLTHTGCVSAQNIFVLSIAFDYGSEESRKNTFMT
jgi:hypothetical protein